MRIPSLLILFAVGLIPAADAGNPGQAAAVRSTYERQEEAWQLELKLAKTNAERRALLGKRPDKVAAARKMWEAVAGDLNHRTPLAGGGKPGGIVRDLDKEWTLEPASWFLRIASPLAEVGADGIRRPLFAKEVQAVQEAVAAHHVASAKLAPMCMALVAVGDNTSMGLLRRIERENPDEKVRGVAALGIAMLDKNLGDDPKVMRERLTMLRKAIVDASDVVIDGSSVAQMAEDELYIIMNLSKGRVAPNLDGVDSGGRPMSLSSFQGKVILLLFWNSAVDSPAAIIDMVKSIREDERFAGKGFEVVGVNSDSREALREMQKEKGVDWPNFSDPQNELGKVYRVGNWPLAYVLDGDRTIHYFGSMGTFAELTAAAVLEQQ